MFLLKGYRRFVLKPSIALQRHSNDQFKTNQPIRRLPAPLNPKQVIQVIYRFETHKLCDIYRRNPAEFAYNRGQNIRKTVW